MGRYKKTVSAKKRKELKKLHRQLKNIRYRYLNKATWLENFQKKQQKKSWKEEYREWWESLGITVIFVISLALGILAIRYGVNLFSLFSQTF
jgi:hypothetical protein